LEDVRELYRKAHGDFIEGRPSDSYISALYADGEILGFPSCCVQAYALERRALMERRAEEGRLGKGSHFGNSERRARKQLSSMASADIENGDISPERIIDLPLDVLASYFTLDIYPCEPGCREGTKTGLEILEKTERFDPAVANLYRENILWCNALRIWSGMPESTKITNEVIQRELDNFEVEFLAERMSMELRARSEGRKLGRNDPCPCRSGDKFKNCHGM